MQAARWTAPLSPDVEQSLLPFYVCEWEPSASGDVGQAPAHRPEARHAFLHGSETVGRLFLWSSIAGCDFRYAYYLSY